jgi:hypothetical protein
MYTKHLGTVLRREQLSRPKYSKPQFYLEICQPNKDEWREAEKNKKEKKMIRNFVDRKIDSKVLCTNKGDPAGF